MRVARPWHGVPRPAPSVEVSRARLDGVWNNLGAWKVSLHGSSWNGLGFKVPANPNQSVNLVGT